MPRPSTALNNRRTGMPRPSTALMIPTWRDTARGVAWEFGRDISPEEADYLLWEHTGFPEFWNGDPGACCRQQLREFFAQ